VVDAIVPKISFTFSDGTEMNASAISSGFADLSTESNTTTTLAELPHLR